MWKKSQVCSLCIISSHSTTITLSSSFRRQAVHFHSLCRKKIASICHVVQGLALTLPAWGNWFALCCGKIIVCKAEGVRYLKIRVKYSEQESSAWKTDDQGFIWGFWVAQRVTVHSLLQYRNWVHEMYTVCGSGGVCTTREKAEELFATGLVNAKRLYGFKDLREKVEKSTGILLNTVTKWRKKEQYFRNSWLQTLHCSSSCWWHPLEAASRFRQPFSLTQNIFLRNSDIVCVILFKTSCRSCGLPMCNGKFAIIGGLWASIMLVLFSTLHAWMMMVKSCFAIP